MSKLRFSLTSPSFGPEADLDAAREIVNRLVRTELLRRVPGSPESLERRLRMPPDRGCARFRGWCPGRHVPSVDWKHHQVRDEFRRRSAIELPAADEAAKSAEHLGVETRGNREDRVVPGEQIGCRAARRGQRGHRHGRIEHAAAHGSCQSRAARTAVTASSIVTVDPLVLARGLRRLTISAMLGRSARLVNSPGGRSWARQFHDCSAGEPWRLDRVLTGGRQRRSANRVRRSARAFPPRPGGRPRTAPGLHRDRAA
jgi:hypothetical protein